jgi:hypothetical protein
VRLIKGLISRNVYLKRELDNSSKPNKTRAKGSPPEEIQQVTKSYSLYLWVMLQKGVDEIDEDDDTVSEK